MWTSNGTTMVKVLVDQATGAITNAATLRTLGLGATDAEAALVARWMLGDPAMKNPGALGAIVNSTPTQVGRSPEPSLTYVGASDGMLHAFHSRTQTVGGVTYTGGREAFAYIPQDMLAVITRLFAQGGQRADPGDTSSVWPTRAKVKRICTANCTSTRHLEDRAGHARGLRGQRRVHAGHHRALRRHGPEDHRRRSPGAAAVEHPDRRRREIRPPTIRRWARPSRCRASTSRNRPPGTTTARSSRPATPSSTNSAVGLKIVNASAHTGGRRHHRQRPGPGTGLQQAQAGPHRPTLLADVAIARRFGSQDFERIAAAYVGDTWGNLFRYVPQTDSEGNIVAGSGSVSLVDGFSCNHPLHFAPTVVQLDRHDSTKNPGQIFLAQVTNSSSDINTDVWSAGFPASQLVIRKDVAAAGSAVNADPSWGDALGRIVLDSSNPSQICGVWNAAGSSCTTPLPANARPAGSPTGILRSDFDGFALVTLWYVPDASGCTKGQTYLTIHEVDASESVKQIHGEKVADEPVVGAVFAAGKLMVALSNGPKPITSNQIGPIKLQTTTTGATTTLVDRYRRIGWTELP